MTTDELQTRLLNAIKAIDVVEVERALVDGANANGVYEFFGDHTPFLVLAAEKGEWKVVRLLLNHGADISARATRSRQSIYHDDMYDEDDGNALQRAITYNRFDVVEFLLQRGANAAEAMRSALGTPRILKLLLDRGANPNGPHLGQCVTHGSLSQGNLEGVRLLLEYGADPNQIGWGGKSVMLNAIEFGRLEEARALLAAGANMPTRDEVEKAIADAWVRIEEAFRQRALSTAQALGFDITMSRLRRHAVGRRRG